MKNEEKINNIFMKKNFLKFFLNRNTLSKSLFRSTVLKKGKNYPQGPQNLTFPPICPVYRPVPFCELYSSCQISNIIATTARFCNLATGVTK